MDMSIENGKKDEVLETRETIESVTEGLAQHTNHRTNESEDIECKNNIVIEEISEEEYNNIVVRPITIDSVVMRVSSMVASEIRGGSWMMPVSNIKSNNNDNDVISHLNMSSTAIDQFTLEMILPSLIGSGIPNTKKGQYYATLATFLSLREILIQNFDLLLGFVIDDSQKKNDGGTSNMNNNSVTAKIYSTAIILAAVRKFQNAKSSSIIVEEQDNKKSNEQYNNYSNLVNTFLQTIQSYDSADEEFASFLKKPLTNEANCRGVTPTGRILGKVENESWMVSFNTVRQKHPLVIGRNVNEQEQQESSKRQKIIKNNEAITAVKDDDDNKDDDWQKLQTLSRIPTPNACSLFIIEQIPYQKMKNEFYNEIDLKRKEEEQILLNEHTKNVKYIQEKITAPPLPDFIQTPSSPKHDDTNNSSSCTIKDNPTDKQQEQLKSDEDDTEPNNQSAKKTNTENNDDHTKIITANNADNHQPDDESIASNLNV